MKKSKGRCGVFRKNFPGNRFTPWDKYSKIIRNRGNYTAGLAFGQDKSFLSSAVQGHIGEYVGTVRVVGGRFLCESAERPAEGDCFKVLRSGTELCGARFGGAAKGGFFVTAPKRLKNGDKLFITTDTRLNERLLAPAKYKFVLLL